MWTKQKRTTNTAANAAARVPYLGYLPNGFQQNGFDGVYNYNSMQVTVRKNYTNGLGFQAGYTFSKNMSTVAWDAANINLSTDMAQQYGQTQYGQAGQSQYGRAGQSQYGQQPSSAQGQPGQYGQGQSQYGQQPAAPAYGQQQSVPYQPPAEQPGPSTQPGQYGQQPQQQPQPQYGQQQGWSPQQAYGTQPPAENDEQDVPAQGSDTTAMKQEPEQPPPPPPGQQPPPRHG